MRESQMYLQFFKKWLWLLGILGLLGMLGGFYKVQRMPDVWFARSTYEFNYNQDIADSVQKQSDEAVSILRTQELQQSLSLETNSTTIYKPGPYVLEIETQNLDKNRATEMNSILVGYLNKNYSVHPIGQEVISQFSKPFLKTMLLLAGLGVGIGLIISLVISYFKNF